LVRSLSAVFAEMVPRSRKFGKTAQYSALLFDQVDESCKDNFAFVGARCRRGPWAFVLAFPFIERTYCPR
jgi:hypothetical protein